MNSRISFILSAIFHPVFVNLASLFLLFKLYPALKHGVPINLQYYYVSYLFITTCLIPLVVVLALRLAGKIKSISIESKEERRFPYLITFLLYVFNLYNLSKYGTPSILMAYLFGCAVIMLLVICINYFYKISIHTVTIGALSGVLMAAAFYTNLDVRIILAGWLILSGLVGSARLFAKSHNPAQVYLGFLIGSFFMTLVLVRPLIFML